MLLSFVAYAKVRLNVCICFTSYPPPETQRALAMDIVDSFPKRKCAEGEGYVSHCMISILLPSSLMKDNVPVFLFVFSSNMKQK